MTGVPDFIVEKGIVTVEELTENVGCDADTAESILEWMEMEGYLNHHTVDGASQYKVQDVLVDRYKDDDIQDLEAVIDRKANTSDDDGYDSVDVFDRFSFYVNDLVRSVTVGVTETAGNVNIKRRATSYRIYRCSWDRDGKGFFLFVDPNGPFDVTEGSAHMTTDTLSKQEVSSYTEPNMDDKGLADMLGMSYDESTPTWTRFKTKVDNGSIDVRKPVEPLPDQMTEQTIEKLDIDRALDIYMRGNTHIDEDIKYVFRAQLVDFHDKTNRVDHSEVMEANPHTLMITNTGVGKSTTASEIGNLVGDASSAGLLGFADADSVNPGALDGETGLVALDEVEKTDTKFLEKLNNFMSCGEMTVQKGKGKVRTEGSPTMMAFANPSLQEDDDISGGNDVTDYGSSVNEEELMRSFDDFLHSVATGSAYGMLGRRLAVVVFGDDFDMPRPDPSRDMTKENLYKNKVIVDSMLNQTRSEVCKLFDHPDVRSWRKQPVPEYEEAVQNNLKQKDNMLKPVKKFWIKNAKANRRIRGFALKQSLLDHIDQLWSDDNFDPDEYVSDVLSTADDHLARVINVNLESLQRMGEVETTDEDILYHKWRSLGPEQRALAQAVAYYCESGYGDKVVSDSVKLSRLSKFYSQVDSSMKPNSVNTWADVEDTVVGNAQRFSRSLDRVMGIQVVEEDNLMVEVNDTSILSVSGEILGRSERESASSSDSTQDSGTLRESVRVYAKDEGPVDVDELVDKYGPDARDVVDNLVTDGELYEVASGRVDTI